MTVGAIERRGWLDLVERWRTPLTAALLATAVLVAVQAIQGFPTLQGTRNDNDALLRMVEVRDLLGGQPWFDLMQYRMGAPGGFQMHWSRLVDAPIAAIVAIATTVTGNAAQGQLAAFIIWPTLCFFVAFYLLVRAARTYGGDAAILPATVIGFATLYSLGQFAAGSIDHHNVQFALIVATLAFTLEARERPRLAYAVGLAAGLSVAIGMETIHYVAAAGIVMAVWYLLEGDRAAPAVSRFGLAFAGTAIATMLITVPLVQWTVAACDAFSIAQFSAVVLGGLGLALVSATPTLRRTLWRRAASLVALAFVVFGTIAIFFPQCLAAPYADLDPRHHIYWLRHIREVRPVWTMVQQDWTIAIGYYATPVLGAIVATVALLRGPVSMGKALVCAFMLFAMLTAAWQLRGALFACGLAVVPLSAWIARWRQRAETRGLATKLMSLITWVASINLAWTVAGFGVSVVAGWESAEAKPVVQPGTACETESGMAPLDALPPTTVLADINAGAAILLYTHHRALVGPYHRNPGNVTGYEIRIGDSEQARRLMAENGITLVAVCRGVDETPAITRDRPDGLHARLMRNDLPAWLQPIEGVKDQRLMIYRVVPAT